MAWEWAGPTIGGVVGVAGVTSGWLIASGERRFEQRRQLSSKVRDERRAAYLAFLEVVISAGERLRGPEAASGELADVMRRASIPLFLVGPRSVAMAATALVLTAADTDPDQVEQSRQWGTQQAVLIRAMEKVLGYAEDAKVADSLRTGDGPKR